MVVTKRLVLLLEDERARWGRDAPDGAERSETSQPGLSLNQRINIGTWEVPQEVMVVVGVETAVEVVLVGVGSIFTQGALVARRQDDVWDFIYRLN